MLIFALTLLLFLLLALGLLKFLKWKLKLLLSFPLFYYMYLVLHISLSALFMCHKIWYVVSSFPFFSLHFKQFILWLPLWPMNYSEMCRSVSKCVESFMLSFRYWFVVCFHCGKRIHFIWFKFLQLPFLMAQNIGHLGLCSMEAWKACAFCCCWEECSINVD